MARFYEEFPYTNTTDINLDWLIEVVRQLDERVTALEDQTAALDERVTALENGGA